MRRTRLLLAAVAATTATAVWVGVAAAPASADYGPLAVYQVALSFNCNTSFCAPEYGGFWGWAVFNSDGTADAELTGCTHLRGGPSESNGAGHESIDATGWFIGGNGNFWISHEEDTFTGHGKPVTVQDPNPPYPMDTGIPAAPGHYSTAELLGFQPPPGVAFQVQVTKIPNR